MVNNNSELNTNNGTRVFRTNPNSLGNQLEQSLAGSGTGTASGILRGQLGRPIRQIEPNPGPEPSPNPGPNPNPGPIPVPTPAPVIPTTLEQMRAASDADGDDVVTDFEALNSILAGKITDTNIDLLSQLNTKAPLLRTLVATINADGNAISDLEVGAALTALKDANSILSKLEANTTLGANPAYRKSLVDYVLGKNPSMAHMPISQRTLSNQGVIDALLNGVTNSTPLLGALNANLTKLREILAAINTDGNRTISNTEAQAALTALKNNNSALAKLAAGIDLGLITYTLAAGTTLPSSAPRTESKRLIDYIIYKNTTLDSIDANNDGLPDDKEVINALLKKTIEAGAFLDAISLKSTDLVKLVKAIDANEDGIVTKEEVLATLAELNKPGSVLSVLKANTGIGQALIDYVLSKNTSTVIVDYKAINRNGDGQISNEEVFNKLLALGTSTIPESIKSILETNPNYNAIKNLVAATNFNTLNHSNDGAVEVTDVVKLNNAKAVFIALLNARALGLDELIKSKITPSGGGYSDVNKVYEMVMALDPDANGKLDDNTYIQSYKNLKAIAGIPAYMSSMLTKLTVPGKTVYDFSSAKPILDKITLANGDINYAAIGTAIKNIKKPPVPATTPAVDTNLLMNLTKSLVLANIPSTSTSTRLNTFLDTATLTTNQKTTFINRINNAQTLAAALAVIDDINDMVPVTSTSNAAIMDLKTKLRNDFALITAVNTVKLTANMPLSEYVDLSTALLNTTPSAADQSVIDIIKSSYTETNTNPLNPIDIKKMIDWVNARFKGKVVDSTTVAAMVSDYNRNVQTNGTMDVNKLIIASQALRSINPEALTAISSASQNISDANVFDQLRALNLTSTTIVPEALRVVLATNPHYSQIKTLLINTNFNTLNKVNSGTTVTDAVRLDNAKAVFNTLLEARKAGLDTAMIKSKIQSSASGGTGYSDVNKIYQLVEALDPDKNGVVNPDNYPQAYVKAKALAASEPYLASILTKFTVNATTNLYDFTEAKTLLDKVTYASGAIDYTKFGNEIKNIKASTASIAAKNASVNTLKSLLLTSIPAQTTLDALYDTTPDPLHPTGLLASITSLTAEQKTNLVNSIKNAQTLAASLDLIDDIPNAIANATAIAGLKTALTKDFALISVINTIQFATSTMSSSEYIDLVLAIKKAEIAGNNATAFNSIKTSYTATPTATVIQDVVTKLYGSFDGKVFTADNIAAAYNTYNTLIKNASGTVDSARVLVANETLRKINPNALNLITLRNILDGDGDGTIENIDLAKALFLSRAPGGSTNKAVIDAFLDKPENSSRAAMIRSVVTQIDSYANGIVARDEFVTNYVKYIEGKFTVAEGEIVLELLKTSPKYSTLTPILNDVNLTLSPGADLGNNEVAAALLALRKTGRITQADLDTKLVALGVATRAANGLVTYDADATRIKGLVDTLAGYTGISPAGVPRAIDGVGVSPAFLRYYLKAQALGWPADTSFPAAIKNSATVIEDVNSILKSNFEYQRTKDLMTKFVSVSGTTKAFDYNSLVKILLQKNASGADALSASEYAYFISLIPASAFKTDEADLTTGTKNKEIAALEKAIKFIKDNNSNLASIKTHFNDLANASGDNMDVDFNADGKTGADDTSSGLVKTVDRNILNGVLSAMGLGTITW